MGLGERDMFESNSILLVLVLSKSEDVEDMKKVEGDCEGIYTHRT